MPAYVILDINVTDAECYEEYKKLAPSAIESFGGRYLVSVQEEINPFFQ